MSEQPKNPAAVALGRLGGRVRSEAKAVAARKAGLAPCRPGRKRGRPPKAK